ncbi:GspMb/PilO family protein [Eubacteriaceae bacterium ES2]|nr:GspMb/PilO family protein [Eubacteriaceae bacterium ES2]
MNKLPFLGHLKRRLLAAVIFFLLGLILIYPQIQEINSNRILIENKERILAAYQGGMSEDEYLQQLNAINLQVGVYNEWIPLEENQTRYYERISQAVENAGVSLVSVHFGEATEATDTDFNDPAGSLTDPDGRILFALPLDLTITGSESNVLALIAAMENGSPFLKVQTVSLEETQNNHIAQIGAKGYFFAD